MAYGVLNAATPQKVLISPSPTFTLPIHPDYPDNAQFDIGWARPNALCHHYPPPEEGDLDYETKTSYKLLIRATEADGTHLDKEVTLQLTNVNEPPIGVTLDNTTIAENSPADTVVGTLTAIDPDEGDTHTFTLTDPAQHPDNTHFTIDGDQLKTAANLSYELTPVLNLGLIVTDAGGSTMQQVVTVQLQRDALEVSKFFVEVGASWDGKSPNRPAGSIKDIERHYIHDSNIVVYMASGTYRLGPDDFIGLAGNSSERTFVLKGGYAGNGDWKESNRNPGSTVLAPLDDTTEQSGPIFQSLDGWYRSASTVEGITFLGFKDPGTNFLWT